MKCKIINGWLLIDKPIGISSYTVIRKLKQLYNPSKIGHGGTLDPLASGVLAIAFGEATKTVDYVMSAPKSYEFTIKFGEATTTFDLEGEVNETSDYLPTEVEIKNIIPSFLGEKTEIPPNFSAVKVNGVRAYKLARANKEFELKPRKVTVHKLDLLEYSKENKTATFSAKVSKGAYIRSLGCNIAKKLGSVAHITSLRRLELGGLKEKPLLKLIELYNNDKLLQDYLIAIEDVLDDIPAINLNKLEAEAILQGKALYLNESYYGKEVAACYKALYNGKVISLLEIKENKTNILRNFNLVKISDS